MGNIILYIIKMKANVLTLKTITLFRNNLSYYERLSGSGAIYALQ